jgi:predicted metalloprotease with PDZ domain
MYKTFAIILCIALHTLCFAQNPFHNYKDAVQTQFSNSQPVINYTVTVDTADLSSISVQINLGNIADTFRLAMYAHPEYDDKYWRYVEGVQAETSEGNANVFREDSAVWRIITHHNKAVIHYKIQLPQLPAFRGMRPAWRPFLSPTGGLIGDYHSFMYVVGQSLAPSHIRFNIPKGWQMATGLEPTADHNIFFAPSAGILMDAPVLIGQFKSWHFEVDGVPHTVAYWALPDVMSFDTATFVADIQRIVWQASALFGRLPYREYFFLFQDGSYGSLEHHNSVTIGLPSRELAESITRYFSDISHEYFHTWNIIRIRPAEYGDVNYIQPPLSRGLWWSEGITMFYSDLLLRRAGIAGTLSKISHLKELIERYYNNAGNYKFSPEKVSMAANAPAVFLGDYQASTHLQGEIIGNLLDIIIRDATRGQHSMDDLMRSMFIHFGGEQGFTGKDIEQLMKGICNCHVHSFFENYIRGNQPVDFNKYLNKIGLKMDTTWTEAISSDKKPMPDMRVYAWNDRKSNTVKLLLTDPENCWGMAGLHTGDVIKEINNTLVNNTDDFYRLLKNFQIGNTVNIEVERNTGIFKTTILITGYKQVAVHIISLPGQTAQQQQLQTDWLSGK